MNSMEKQHTRSDKDNKEKTLSIKLIKGSFSLKEAEELITALIHVKIKFHENKISTASSDREEDMKMREKRIIELQKDLYEVRQYLSMKKGQVSLSADIFL